MEINKRRRSFLFGGAAIGLVGGFSTVNGLAASVAEAHPLTPEDALSTSDRHFHLTASSQSEHFRIQFQKYFSHLLNDPVMQTLLPFSAIVEHRSGPPVIAYKLSWQLNTPDGSPLSQEMTVFRRPVFVKSVNLNKVTRSANQPILRAGDVALVSPFFVFGANDSHRDETGPDWAAILHQHPSQRFLASQLRGLQMRSAALVSIIYADRKVVDRDNGLFAKQLQQRCNAEIQLSKAVAERLRSGSPERRLRNALGQAAIQHHFERPGSSEAVFRESRRRQAGFYKYYLEQYGIAKLEELVTHIGSHSMVQFEKASA